MNIEGVKISEILERYPAKPEYLIFLLQDIQKQYGFISSETMEQICDRTGVPLTQAYSVATFYQSFRLEPKGEHEIKVCLGTACHLKGGPRIVNELERRLGVKAGETTSDMKFTFDTVNCLGACAIAPVIVIDEEYHPNMTAQKLEKQIKTLGQDMTEVSEVLGHA
ncbi:MAG: NAD(P)H-dependent oxidoreductase subunit E [Desulfobacterales bacterium]|nr:NAD(P)H-dependent oxidoreductase subunit E [Desulfobacterales bacterium]MBF0397524.1 NAD(P)H-dependent oxidoreductase subunit E [Desulfobacterales bacterium]